MRRGQQAGIGENPYVSPPMDRDLWPYAAGPLGRDR